MVDALRQGKLRGPPAPMIRVTVPDLKALTDCITKVRQDELQELMLAHGKTLAQELAHDYPQHRAAWREGRLRAVDHERRGRDAMGRPGRSQHQTGRAGAMAARGNGIHGPEGEPIAPTNSQALAFTWLGQTWALGSVQGIKPNPWQRDATEAAMGLSVTQVRASASRSGIA